MNLNLCGKRVLVTGSTNGIGQGIAMTMAAEGCRVIVHGRVEERARDVVAKIVAADGEAAFVLGDHGSDAGAEQIARGAQKAFDGIDILVNCAGGRSAEYKKFVEWPEIEMDQWTDTYNVNVLGPVRLIRRLVEPMKSRGWGRIINIGTVLAQTPSAQLADYCSAKAGMAALTLSLSKWLANTGVTCNLVSPGVTSSPSLVRFLRTLAENAGHGPDEAVGAQIFRASSLPQTVARFGEVGDIARMVTFVASPLADFINGANFRIDGGGSPACN